MNAKKLAKGITVIALIAIIAVGATLAYLTATTNTAKNEFTGSKDITGTLTETEWNYGKDGWKNYQPGDATGKNPVVTIGSGSEEAYVGMKIVFTDNDSNTIDFGTFTSKYASVQYKDANGDYQNGINPNWVYVGNIGGKGDFFVYKGKIDASAAAVSTPAIFDRVVINTGIKTVFNESYADKTVKTYTVAADGTKTLVDTKLTKESYDSNTSYYDSNGNLLTVSKLPHFNMDITGYAVQTKNLTMAADYKSGTALDQLETLAGLK